MADFEALDSLGTNAYGTVYRGVQFSLKRDVAIYELNEALRKEAAKSSKLWDEIGIVAQITDAYLVPVYAIDRDRGWVVLEYMQGHCAQLLKKPQSPAIARSILKQGLAGLARLHAEGRTHGDIRPNTILINRGGRIKLGFSFGAAVVGRLPYHKRMMKYVAPEIVSPAFGEFGPASDLYSLGFSVLELMLGPKFESRFPGVGGEESENRTAWMRWHADPNAVLPSVRELVPAASAELVVALDRLLKKRVSERYASAEDALRELAQVQLVAIEAPELGVTGGAAAGKAADLEKIYDPNSKYDGPTANEGSGYRVPIAKADDPQATVDPRAAAKAKAAADAIAAAEDKAAAKAAKASDAKRRKEAARAAALAPEAIKRKKNRRAAVVALLLFGIAAAIMLRKKPSEPAPPIAAESPAEVPVVFRLNEMSLSEVIEGQEVSIAPALTGDSAPNGQLSFQVIGEAPEDLTLDPKTGQLAWTPSEADGPSERTIKLRVVDAGTPPQTAETQWTIRVAESNAPPKLRPVAPQTVEPNMTFELQLNADDSDFPRQQLTYRLEGDEHFGAAIDAATGRFTWVAPATSNELVREFHVVVADDGEPALEDRATIRVTTAPRNYAPQFVWFGGAKSFQIEENKFWTLSLYARDKETPVERLKFELLDAPETMRLVDATRALEWRPSEKQGPGEYEVRVRVTDDGEPAAVDEQVITVAVGEVPSPPVFSQLPTQRLKVGQRAVAQVQADDSDHPTQVVRYRLLSTETHPEGLVLDPDSGVLTWTATSFYAGETIRLTVEATDGGSPPMIGRGVVVLSVESPNQAPVIEPIPVLSVIADGGPNQMPGTTFRIQANDPDGLNSKLRYTLAAPVPEGARIDQYGLFTYALPTVFGLDGRPIEVDVEVSDSGTPPGQATATIRIQFSPGFLLAALRFQLDRSITIPQISSVLRQADALRQNTPVDREILDKLVVLAYIKRGDAGLALQNFEAAKADFNAVLANYDSDNIDALLGRAYCDGVLGDWRGARAQFDGIIQLAPNYAKAFHNRAIANFELGNWDDVLDDCDRAVSLGFNDPFTLFVRANANLNLSRESDALDDLKSAIRLFLAQGNPNKALFQVTLEKAMEIMDNNPDLYNVGLMQSYRDQVGKLRESAPTTVPPPTAPPPPSAPSL